MPFLVLFSFLSILKFVLLLRLLQQREGTLWIANAGIPESTNNRIRKSPRFLVANVPSRKSREQQSYAVVETIFIWGGGLQRTPGVPSMLMLLETLSTKARLRNNFLSPPRRNQSWSFLFCGQLRTLRHGMPLRN